MANNELPMPYGYTRRWRGPDAYHVRQPTPAGLRLLRLGLIGLGGVAQAKHLPALQRLRAMGEPVEIPCGADLDPGLGTKVARQYGLALYADHRNMLDQERLDAVEVLIRPEVPKAQVIRDCLVRGLPVLVEKPLLDLGVERSAEALAEAEALCRLAEEEHVPLMVGFVKRYAPPYANAQALVAGGAIGRPTMLAAKMCQGWDGPRFLEQSACHLLDLVRFFLGDLHSLFAYGTKQYGRTAYPFDNVCISLRFQSGAVGTLHLSQSTLSLKPWERVEVYGDRAWLSVDDSCTLTLYDNEEGPAKVWRPVWPHTLLFDEEFSGFVWQIKAFLDAVRSRQAVSPSGWDGCAAMHLASAIHHSVTTSLEVTLSGSRALSQRESLEHPITHNT